MQPLVKQPYPALDTDGWIRTPEHVVDHLLSDFFLSDYSQTENFTGRVASYAWLVHEYQADTGRLSQEVAQALTSYFMDYFYDVDATVTWANEDNTINRQKLIISMQITDGAGTIHELVRIANQDGFKVTSIIAVMNDG